MIKKVYNFQSCSSTAGRPFDDGPRCPLYQKTDGYLKGGGWKQTYYNSSKTGTGDLCNLVYKKLDENPDGNGKDVMDKLEVNIEGTKKTCKLTAVISTFRPNNIIQTIDHNSEQGIMEGFESFLRNNCDLIKYQ